MRIRNPNAFALLVVATIAACVTAAPAFDSVFSNHGEAVNRFHQSTDLVLYQPPELSLHRRGAGLALLIITGVFVILSGGAWAVAGIMGVALEAGALSGTAAAALAAIGVTASAYSAAVLNAVAGIAALIGAITGTTVGICQAKGGCPNSRRDGLPMTDMLLSVNDTFHEVAANSSAMTVLNSAVDLDKGSVSLNISLDLGLNTTSSIVHSFTYSLATDEFTGFLYHDAGASDGSTPLAPAQADGRPLSSSSSSSNVSLVARQSCGWGQTATSAFGCTCLTGWRPSPDRTQCCSPNSSYKAGSGCVCDAGTSWDGGSKQCVGKTPSNCPWGTVPQGSTCVCRGGGWWPAADGQCCSPNSHFVAGSGCVCNAGSTFDGNTCVGGSPPPPPPPPPPPQVPAFIYHKSANNNGCAGYSNDDVVNAIKNGFSSGISEHSGKAACHGVNVNGCNLFALSIAFDYPSNKDKYSHTSASPQEAASAVASTAAETCFLVKGQLGYIEPKQLDTIVCVCVLLLSPALPPFALFATRGITIASNR
ncbi:hypothetical protein DFJ73DRAFT_765149 [Zopfochytrium polystomum]|nr:hypothetical protein DFJ73DRAFT_765149 [Zopfochytrium polystomum]